ncbi:MAG: DUF512 domain-containing protein [Actinomycetota bacterium]|nr:DUF512 domain-containing protein [Actinomycetota bacterium]
MIRGRREARARVRWRPPRVREVREDSICRGHVQPGDHLLEIDGRPPMDVLDYLEASERDMVSLRLERRGREMSFKRHKQVGRPLGLIFDEAVFDGIRTCRNRCIFCFVDQMPPGMRPTLYVKDDDYRLSFYYGNFITLNNLGAEDLRRIRRLRLSPLYVSLHSTDAELRERVMGGNARAGLEALELLLSDGIEIHLQVVVCPGINDGEALRDTLRDVLERYPAASLAMVPLGLTSRAGELSPLLKAHDGASSNRVINLVEEYQHGAMERTGGRIFFASDEFYLMAERPFPGGKEYEGYPQLENGVGMARKFIDEAREAVTAGLGHLPARLPGILTGAAGERVMTEALADIPARCEVEVVCVENRMLGGSVTATSLLGGEDIVRCLRDQRRNGEKMLLAETLLREGRFLDDMTLEDVESETGCELVPVRVDGASLLQALAGEEGGA